MTREMLPYFGVALLSVFISGISQVMLKKSANQTYNSLLEEYLNPLVFFAYVLFLGATMASTVAFKAIPLSMGPMIDATGYIYVTFFGITIFHERLNPRKVLALGIIICGIVIYTMGL